MVTNGFHASVREDNDVEENRHQTEGNDDKAQCDDCFYHIDSLWSYAVHQH